MQTSEIDKTEPNITPVLVPTYNGHPKLPGLANPLEKFNTEDHTVPNTSSIIRKVDPKTGNFIEEKTLLNNSTVIQKKDFNDYTTARTLNEDGEYIEGQYGIPKDNKENLNKRTKLLHLTQRAFGEGIASIVFVLAVPLRAKAAQLEKLGVGKYKTYEQLRIERGVLGLVRKATGLVSKDMFEWSDEYKDLELNIKTGKILNISSKNDLNEQEKEIWRSKDNKAEAIKEINTIRARKRGEVLNRVGLVDENNQRNFLNAFGQAFNRNNAFNTLASGALGGLTYANYISAGLFMLNRFIASANLAQTAFGLSQARYISSLARPGGTFLKRAAQYIGTFGDKTLSSTEKTEKRAAILRASLFATSFGMISNLLSIYASDHLSRNILNNLNLKLEIKFNQSGNNIINSARNTVSNLKTMGELLLRTDGGKYLSGSIAQIISRSTIDLTVSSLSRVMYTLLAQKRAKGLNSNTYSEEMLYFTEAMAGARSAVGLANMFGLYRNLWEQNTVAGWIVQDKMLAQRDQINANILTKLQTAGVDPQNPVYKNLIDQQNSGFTKVAAATTIKSGLGRNDFQGKPKIAFDVDPRKANSDDRITEKVVTEFKPEKEFKVEAQPIPSGSQQPGTSQNVVVDYQKLGDSINSTVYRNGAKLNMNNLGPDVANLNQNGIRPGANENLVATRIAALVLDDLNKNPDKFKNILGGNIQIPADTDGKIKLAFVIAAKLEQNSGDFVGIQKGNVSADQIYNKFLDNKFRVEPLQKIPLHNPYQHLVDAKVLSVEQKSIPVDSGSQGNNGANNDGGAGFNTNTQGNSFANNQNFAGQKLVLFANDNVLRVTNGLGIEEYGRLSGLPSEFKGSRFYADKNLTQIFNEKGIQVGLWGNVNGGRVPLFLTWFNGKRFYQWNGQYFEFDSSKNLQPVANVDKFFSTRIFGSNMRTLSGDNMGITSDDVVISRFIPLGYKDVKVSLGNVYSENFTQNRNIFWLKVEDQNPSGKNTQIFLINNKGDTPVIYEMQENNPFSNKLVQNNSSNLIQLISGKIIEIKGLVANSSADPLPGADNITVFKPYTPVIENNNSSTQIYIHNVLKDVNGKPEISSEYVLMSNQNADGSFNRIVKLKLENNNYVDSNGNIYNQFGQQIQSEPILSKDQSPAFNSTSTPMPSATVPTSTPNNTITPTPTSTVPTSTNTQVPPTYTATPTPSPITPTVNPTNTNTTTPTAGVPTATNTPQPTYTNTPTPSPISPTANSTNTNTTTSTTAIPTSTNTSSPLTSSPVPLVQNTQSTQTPYPTQTAYPTNTTAPTNTPYSTQVSQNTPTPTVTNTQIPPTSSSTINPSPTNTPSMTLKPSNTSTIIPNTQTSTSITNTPNPTNTGTPNISSYRSPTINDIDKDGYVEINDVLKSNQFFFGKDGNLQDGDHKNLTENIGKVILGSDGNLYFRYSSVATKGTTNYWMASAGEVDGQHTMIPLLNPDKSIIDALKPSSTLINTPTDTLLPTASNTPTVSPSLTNTIVNTSTVTNTSAPSSTNTSTLSPTNSPTPVYTNTPTQTNTSTIESTLTKTVIPTNTPTPNATNTASVTPIIPSPTKTQTPTVKASLTSSSTPTATPTVEPTNTLIPSVTNTNTSIPTQTSTSSPTVKATTVVPTSTNTATATLTPTVTASSTNTPIPTNTQTPTLTPTQTSTITPSPTTTLTNTATATLTPTVTASSTNTITPTNTQTPTLTPTQTSTQTITPSPTATLTNTATVTLTPTVTASSTNTITPTNTQTPTLTPTQTSTITPTSTITNTASPTITSTPTSNLTLTPTSTNTITPASTSEATQLSRKSEDIFTFVSKVKTIKPLDSFNDALQTLNNINQNSRTIETSFTTGLGATNENFKEAINVAQNTLGSKNIRPGTFISVFPGSKSIPNNINPIVLLDKKLFVENNTYNARYGICGLPTLIHESSNSMFIEDSSGNLYRVLIPIESVAHLDQFPKYGNTFGRTVFYDPYDPSKTSNYTVLINPDLAKLGIKGIKVNFKISVMPTEDELRTDSDLKDIYSTFEKLNNNAKNNSAKNIVVSQDLISFPTWWKENGYNELLKRKNFNLISKYFKDSLDISFDSGDKTLQNLGIKVVNFDLAHRRDLAAVWKSTATDNILQRSWDEIFKDFNANYTEVNTVNSRKIDVIGRLLGVDNKNANDAESIFFNFDTTTNDNQKLKKLLLDLTDLNVLSIKNINGFNPQGLKGAILLRAKNNSDVRIFYSKNSELVEITVTKEGKVETIPVQSMKWDNLSDNDYEIYVS